MKLKNVLSYVNVLYLVLSVFTAIKLIYFTWTVNSELSTPLQGSEFVWNKYILSYLFCAFSFFSIALIFNGKKSLNILFGMNIFLSFFMFANLIYFRSFDSYLSVYNLAQYRNFGVVGPSAIALIQPKDILLFVDPIIIGITYRFWKKLALKQKEMSVRQRIVVSIFPIFCAGIALNYCNFFSPTITKIEAGARYSILGHQYYDLSSYIGDYHNTVKRNDVRDEIEAWFNFKNKEVDNSNLKSFGQFKGQNVIFLQVESLENFVINRKIENQEITPNLNKLVKHSIYFNNIIAQENGGNSSDADFIANTSLLPLKSGSVSYRFPANGYNSLPVILRKAGYQSHVIHSGEGYFWNKSAFLPRLGFDTYTDIDGMKVREEDKFFMGLKDEVHLSQVAAYANTLSEPFYLFTVTETSHTPFELPAELQSLKLNKDFNETIFGRYFQAIHYTDKSIGTFMNKLEKDGILDNTIVVIYGDHEGIHKYNNDNVLEKQNPNYQEYDNYYQVPLLIYSSKLKGEVVNKQGGQIDIMPTVLSLLGIDYDVYKDTAMGNNLLAKGKGYAIDKNGVVYGTNLNKEELKNIKKSISISEMIIKSNYFQKYYQPSEHFSYNGKPITLP